MCRLEVKVYYTKSVDRPHVLSQVVRSTNPSLWDTISRENAEFIEVDMNDSIQQESRMMVHGDDIACPTRHRLSPQYNLATTRNVDDKLAHSIEGELEGL